MRRCLSRAVAALAVATLLSGCEVYRPADPEEIARARYVSPEPPSVTLFSMVDVASGRSAHSALLINGSQQVLYDPAGTFTHPDLPRAGDIHYGMTPRFVDYYERYHARFSHFVEVQKVEVDRATADAVLARAEAEGKTLKMLCAGSVTGALQGIPLRQGAPHAVAGEHPQGFLPHPGVEDGYVYENDSGKNRVWERSDTAR